MAMFLDRWRYRQFHESYLLAWCASGLLVGLLLGRLVEVRLEAGLMVITLMLVLTAVHSRRWWAVGMMLIAGMLFGAVRGGQVASSYRHYDGLVDKTVLLKGVVSEDAQRVSGGRWRVTLSHIQIDTTAYPGEVFATVYGDSEVKRGDQLTVRGTLREGFASYGATLSAGKVVALGRPNDMIRDIRERFANAVRAVVMEPTASLGLGFVVGQRSTLPDKLDEQLKVVGLTHIVVASGYNLTILVRFMMRLLSRHSRYLTLVCSLLIILLFGLFSGFSPSMNRAVIVTVLALLAWYVGRRFHPLMLIIYVAAATACVNPMYVWSNVGWYLSFFAFAGILIVAPLTLTYLYKRRAPRSFEQLVMETLCAEVMALPIVALAFGTIPVFGLVANVLVAPFIPAAMALTAITGTIGMFFAPLAAILALPMMILIGYMIAVVQWLAVLPIAQYSLGIGLGVVVVWYGIVTGLSVFGQVRRGYDFRARDKQLEV